MPQLDLVKFSLLFIFVWFILNVSFFLFFTFYFLQKIIVFKLSAYRLRYYYSFFTYSWILLEAISNMRLINCDKTWITIYK